MTSFARRAPWVLSVLEEKELKVVVQGSITFFSLELGRRVVSDSSLSSSGETSVHSCAKLSLVLFVHYL